MKFDLTDLNLFPYFLFILYFLLDKYYFPLRLGKKQFIHKLQFEKEFEIYKKLWIHLAELKGHAKTLVSLLSMPSMPRLTEPEKILKDMQETHRKVYSTIEKNKPFYEESIYESASHVIRKSFEEVIAYYYPWKTDDKKELTLTEERFLEMSTSIDNIEKTMRKRVGNMRKAKLVE